MMLPSIQFDAAELEIDDQTSVSFSFVPNWQRLIISGSFNDAFSSFASVYTSYTEATLYDADTVLDDLEIESDQYTPLVYVVFAYDGSPDGLDEVAAATIKHTAPFDVVITFSGSITPDASTDSRICTVSFSKLILVFQLDSDIGEGWREALGSSSSWLTNYTVDNDWEVSVSSRNVSSPGSTAQTAAIVLLVHGLKAVSHPDQMGYAACYWGGLMCSSGQSATIRVKPTTDCQSVLGPTWLPHTTFYPLVDIGRTPLSQLPTNCLDMPDDDIAYRNTVPGYGIFDRGDSVKRSEELLGSIGELLDVPKEAGDDMSSMLPGPCWTRILQDTCIYPVVDNENTTHITAFWRQYQTATKMYHY